ncbi:hypothetical protein CMALT394_460027 [Carnobacterium maltaromaticum]|nr:hypothetical protein CMALT394_460027 [Carnobacterium maltaromaticum]
MIWLPFYFFYKVIKRFEKQKHFPNRLICNHDSAYFVPSDSYLVI